MSIAHIAIWILSITGILLMLLRPRNIAEVWWIGGAAGIIAVLRLIPFKTTWHAIMEGSDVYLFLAGMMLLAELARSHGVFDWLATLAIQKSKGSSTRLFILIYAVGTLVTIFLSNDATAVVLTPAVLAAVRKSKTEPLPYLFSCAFVANAASFVLPISNPANLVVFHGAIPPLGEWLRIFLAASVVSVIATYAALHWCSRNELHNAIQSNIADGHLSRPGKLAIAGIALVAVVLLITSAFGADLGLPTCLASLVVVIGVSALEKHAPFGILREISWSVIPLVAGLFILVEAMNNAGALHLSQAALHTVQTLPPITAAVTSAFGIGLGTNIINNLPLGLIAGTSLRNAHIVGTLRNTALIGIDLGPNLSVTGSLATILWLIAIRREGMHVSGWTFLKTGMLVMPLALILAALTAAIFH